MAESWLDAITFDTFGWRLVSDSPDRIWVGEGQASLMQRFVPEPQDVDVWDPEEIRAGLELVAGGDETITERMREVEFTSEEMKAATLRGKPEQQIVVELQLFEVGPARCVNAITRHRRRGEIHYSSATQLFFRECFWVVGLEMHDDDELVGEREGAVARELLKAQDSGQEVEGFNPYDRRWDGLVALQHDPLTRVRSLTGMLNASIRLGPRTRELTPIPLADI